MERSGYWRGYTKGWNKEKRGWHPIDPDEKGGGFAASPPVYYGGRFLQLENYLAVPTFLRLGRRLAV